MVRVCSGEEAKAPSKAAGCVDAKRGVAMPLLSVLRSAQRVRGSL